MRVGRVWPLSGGSSMGGRGYCRHGLSLLVWVLVMGGALLLAAAPALANTTISRVSMRSDGTQTAAASYNPSMSANGNWVCFGSSDHLLLDWSYSGVWACVYRVGWSGLLEAVTVNCEGDQPTGDCYYPRVSGDGSAVAFCSFASDLIEGYGGGPYQVWLARNQTNTLVSHSYTSSTISCNARCDSGVPRLSADGQRVLFSSGATDLIPNDTNGKRDLFLWDGANGGMITRVAANATEGDISADGEWIVFTSADSTLVPGDTNGKADIFVCRADGSEVTRVNLGAYGVQANGTSSYPVISGDGSHVAFRSEATNLVPIGSAPDTNRATDIFVCARAGGLCLRVSVASDGSQANGTSTAPSISNDGRVVVFESAASNLVPGDTNSTQDVFVHCLSTGSTERASLAYDSSEANSGCYAATVAGNGGYVAFTSSASNLVSGDTNGKTDVFVTDTVLGSGGEWLESTVFAYVPYCGYTPDPVNRSTGNATDRATDLSLSGKGVNLVFARSYNSHAGASDGPLGHGWTHSYAGRVELVSSTTTAVVYGDGHWSYLTDSGGGSYASPEGVSERLCRNADGTYTLTLLDQSHDEFDGAGRLTATVDRYGNQTTLAYDSEGLLTQISEPGGRYLTLSYSGTRIDHVEDSAGRTVSYGYNAEGDLVTVTDANGHATTYSYDADHQLISMWLPEGSGSPYVTNTYTDGRVTSQVDALGNTITLAYDTENGQTTMTDARGNVSVDTWDAKYRLTSFLDPLGHVASIVHGAQGLPESVTDQNGHTVTYAYDALGKMTAVTDPLGNTSTAGYDPENGNPLWLEDELGRRTTLAWDPTGVLLDSVTSAVGTSSFAWNPDGTLAAVTDANTHTWEYGYDSCGDLTSVRDALGSESAFEHDGSGRVTAFIDSNGNRTEYFYDPVGQLTTVKDALAAADEAGRHQIDITYDANDNQTSITDRNGNRTTFEFDDMELLRRVTNALGDKASYGYDAAYNLTSVTDLRGYATVYTHDPNNRVTSVTDPLGRATTFAYDPVGNLLSTRYANGNRADYTYTADDLLAGVSYSSEPTTWSFVYNPDETLANVEKDDGSTWTFSYDEGGRLCESTDENSPTLGSFRLGYTYDSVGNLTGLDLGGLASLTYVYNSRDELESLVGPGGTTAVTRDPGGRLTQIDTPDGTTISFSYDAAGQPTGLTNATVSGSQTLAYVYDANGNLLSETETCTYDSYHYPSGWAHCRREKNNDKDDKDGTKHLTTYTSTYTYDSLNRLTSWTRYESDKKDKANPRAQQNMEKNAANHLESVTTTYTYDSAGNLIQVQETRSGSISSTETYAYNAANEITTPGFTYDPNGNLTSDGSRTYTYDAEGRLVQVEAAGETLASMAYDFLGRRTSLATTSGTTYFHYDGALLVAESNDSGTITASYAYDDCGSPVSLTRDGQTYFYQLNAHGDVVSLTNQTGEVVNSYTYDPWGVVLEVSETVENPFRYASYHYDTATGLYYLWHRYYDPELKRFLTVDPVGGSLARPTSLNSYLYCEYNPLAYVDPTGLVIDAIADAGFILYDLGCLFFGNPKNVGENLAALNADFGSLLVPFVTGGGLVVRGSMSSADDIAQALSKAAGGIDEAAGVLRAEYEAAVRGLVDEVPFLRAMGLSTEQIARVMHSSRRLLGLVYKLRTDPTNLAKIIAGNIMDYGDPLGPSIKWLRDHGKSWEQIIESACRPGDVWWLK